MKYKKLLAGLLSAAMVLSSMALPAFASSDPGISGDTTVISESETKVAETGGTGYETIQAAVDAAKSGAVINIIGQVSDEAVTISKDVTIQKDASVSAALNNVVITANKNEAGERVELTLKDLKFTGNSYVNTNGNAL